MKRYEKPTLIEFCADESAYESILPSFGAVTGAAHMLAKSAAKAAVHERSQKVLQDDRQGSTDV